MHKVGYVIGSIAGTIARLAVELTLGFLVAWILSLIAGSIVNLFYTVEVFNNAVLFGIYTIVLHLLVLLVSIFVSVSFR